MLNDALWGAVFELAASQHGVFTTVQAANRGVSRKRLATALDRGFICRVRRGVYRVAGTASTWHSDLMALTLATNAVASHRAAARLHQLDSFDTVGLLEAVTTKNRSRRQPGAQMHAHNSLVPRDITTVRGIPTTNRVVTVCLLASVVDRSQLAAALDAALRLGSSYRRIVATEARLRGPGCAGTKSLRRLLAERSPGRFDHRQIRRHDSQLEARTARRLVAAGLPPPTAQHPIRVGDGRIFRVDFAWPHIKLALECHSRQYHFGRDATDRDSDRDLVITASGWQVVYLTAAQITEPHRYLPLLAATIERRTEALKAGT